MSDKLDMGEFEQELAAITRRIELYLAVRADPFHPATVGELMGELDLSLEEVMAASAYHQRRYQALRAAQAQMALERARKGKRGH